jgi:hypothetical protein
MIIAIPGACGHPYAAGKMQLIKNPGKNSYLIKN